MKSRRAAAVFFVALCLVLCGLVLHRQIAAHPLPPQIDSQESFTERQDWHPAKESVSREAQATVRGQLDAFHAGDRAKAMTFQSRRMWSNFSDPVHFEQMIAAEYQEFSHYRSAKFGPVWSDQDGGFAGALVIIQGENGHRVEGKYLLVREDGQLRIANVQSRPLPN